MSPKQSVEPPATTAQKILILCFLYPYAFLFMAFFLNPAFHPGVVEWIVFFPLCFFLATVATWLTLHALSFTAWLILVFPVQTFRKLRPFAEQSSVSVTEPSATETRTPDSPPGSP